MKVLIVACLALCGEIATNSIALYIIAAMQHFNTSIAALTAGIYMYFTVGF
jgi:hypothetical protein